MKKYFDQKVKGCEYLVNLNAKKINKTHIVAAAKLVGLRTDVMENAWNNFVQTGGKYVDKSSKTGSGAKMMPIKRKDTYQVTKERVVMPKEAAEIILEYMRNRDINSTKLSNDNNITIRQFYKWINELNVSGTILGTTILNHKKYAKVNVLDAIWLYKRPETTRKSIKALTATERLAYQRVGDVLVHYLSAL